MPEGDRGRSGGMSDGLVSWRGPNAACFRKKPESARFGWCGACGIVGNPLGLSI